MTAAIGDRIRQARQEAGLSLRELAQRIEAQGDVDGLGYTVIQKIEKGARRVASHELVEIAAQLGTTASVLLGTAGRSANLVLAARVSEIPPSEAYRETTDRAVQILEAADLLARVVGPLPASAPVEIAHVGIGMTARDGSDLAAAVRKTLSLGGAPIADLAALVEKHFGAHVTFEPLPRGRHGFCVMSDEAAVIIVNSADTFGRQRFTLAHELCHLIARDLDTLEFLDETGSTTGVERRADAFAAELLGPRSGLQAAIGNRNVDEVVVADLAHRFGMSLAATTNRLKDLGIIDSATARGLGSKSLKQLSYTAGLHSEWRAGRDREGVRIPPQRLADQAVRAYIAGRIGIGLVADIFGEPDRLALRTRLENQGYAPPVIESALDSV